MDYHRKYNLEIRIVRIFNTYGSRMAENDGRVISNFIVQALKNKNITVFGDGFQTRSFCYVKDLVEGLYKMMNQSYIGPVNLGNTEEIKIIDVAKKIINHTKSSSKIIFNSLPEDDPKQRRPDISLAKEKLSWEPKISFEDGIKKTIEYFKSSLS
jgi:UDP-glucuronate decarboxylase